MVYLRGTGGGGGPVGVSNTGCTAPVGKWYAVAAICPLSLIAVAEKSR
jgi:hypothetical protein